MSDSVLSPRVLHRAGAGLFIGSLAFLLAGTAAAWLRIDPDLTKTGLLLAGAALVAFVLSLLSLVAARLSDPHRAPSSLPLAGWASRIAGWGAVGTGMFLVTLAFLEWRSGPPDDQEALIALRLVGVGVAFALAGLALFAVGHLHLVTSHGRARRPVDATILAVLVLFAALAANPGVVGVDLASESETTHDELERLSYPEALPTPPTSVDLFDGRLQASAKVPLLGVAVNGPGSRSGHEFTVDPLSFVAVAEVRWDTGHPLMLLLEETQAGEWVPIAETNGTSPLLLASYVMPSGTFRVRVFPAGDAEVIPDLQFQGAVSLFAGLPAADYRVL
ncbi:MAG: hypothetical protein ACT4PT_13990 [Methanobacteriota archaeon]